MYHTLPKNAWYTACHVIKSYYPRFVNLKTESQKVTALLQPRFEHRCMISKLFSLSILLTSNNYSTKSNMYKHFHFLLYFSAFLFLSLISLFHLCLTPNSFQKQPLIMTVTLYKPVFQYPKIPSTS